MSLADRLRARLSETRTLSPIEGDFPELRAEAELAAAVLIAITDRPRPGVILTVRRDDLRTHAGQIAFPGGSIDAADRSPEEAALRETEEEIGLAPTRVELSGALTPVSTFVTGYRVHPFVGLVPDPLELGLEPNPSEVETVLTVSLEKVREGYEMRRLVRRGVPIHTPTYEVEGQLIWGATARILGDLLDRVKTP